MSDIRRNIERFPQMLCFKLPQYTLYLSIRLQPSLRFVHWNQQGWKTGHCSVPPIGQVFIRHLNPCLHRHFWAGLYNCFRLCVNGLKEVRFETKAVLNVVFV